MQLQLGILHGGIEYDATLYGNPIWDTELYGGYGILFFDINQNGEWDASIDQIAGASSTDRKYLDYNNNKQYDVGEPEATSDTTGFYYIDSNNNGTYDEGEQKTLDGSQIHYIDDDDIDGYSEGDTITSYGSTSSELRDVVASWYYRLRNLAIVASMLVLIYIGIKIIQNSANPEKAAKYKGMLADWLVSLCLIFFMHYIMYFSVKVVEYINDFIADGFVEGGSYFVGMGIKGDEMTNNINELGLNEYVKDGMLVYPTNMLGYIRMLANFTDAGMAHAGYGMIYFISVIQLIFFVFTYFKRVIYMAFLTMIAPLVALTYPLDKISDGQPQAYNMWFKEYIFNLLIQPMHLLLYFVLISSAFKLASTNFIYSLVAISFMMPAEKLIRKFFGFEKASTSGLLSGALGTALAMKGMQGIGHQKNPPKPSGGKSGGGRSGDSKGGSSSSSDGDSGGGSSVKQKGKYSDLTSRVGSGNTTTYSPTSSATTPPRPSAKMNKAKAIREVAGKKIGKAAINLGKYSAKKGAGIMGGALLGIGAAGMSLAMGNANEATQNAIAAFGIGKNAGSNLLTNAHSGVTKIKDSVTNFKDEVADKVDDGERAREKFMKDKDRIKLIETEFGVTTKSDIDKYMEMLYKYHNYGATNDKISIKAMKSGKFTSVQDSNERMLAATLANRYKGNPDGLEKEEERLKKYKGFTDGDIIRLHNAISDIDGTFA